MNLASLQVLVTLPMRRVTFGFQTSSLNWECSLWLSKTLAEGLFWRNNSKKWNKARDSRLFWYCWNAAFRSPLSAVWNCFTTCYIKLWIRAKRLQISTPAFPRIYLHWECGIGLVYSILEENAPLFFISNRTQFPTVFPSHMGWAFGIHKPLCNLNQVSPCLAVYSHIERRKTLFSRQIQVSSTRQRGKMARSYGTHGEVRKRDHATRPNHCRASKGCELRTPTPTTRPNHCRTSKDCELMPPIFQELQLTASLSTPPNQIPAEHPPWKLNPPHLQV